MKNILLIGSSFTAGGNGDILLETAAKAAEEKGAKTTIVHLRDKKFGYCRGCYGCRESGICVQKDDFQQLLALAHSADAILVAAPIYYNCMDALMLTAVNRLCCTFACKSYALGPQKKIAFLLTCTGSEVGEMTRHVRNITTLSSIQRSIREERIEVFTGCGDKDTCKNTKDYLMRAAQAGAWSAE